MHQVLGHFDRKDEKVHRHWLSGFVDRMVDELCSAYGHTENPLIVWDYTTMSKLQELKEHKDRVLNMELSPNGSTVASVGADEVLMLWDVFKSPSKRSRGLENFSSMMGEGAIPGMSVIR